MKPSYKYLSEYKEEAREKAVNLAKDSSKDQEVLYKEQLLEIANDLGHPNWMSLVRKLRQSGKIKPGDERFAQDPRLYKEGTDETGLNQWFSTYDEDKSYQQAKGGYLFPWGRTFFVTGSLHITSIGLNPNNQDWKKIGYDWYQPEDMAAFSRLESKLPKQEN